MTETTKTIAALVEVGTYIQTRGGWGLVSDVRVLGATVRITTAATTLTIRREELVTIAL